VLRSGPKAGRRRSRLRVAVLVSTAAAVALTACSSSGGKDGGASGSSGAASGSPLRIGFVNQTAGAGGTYPELTAIYDASVSYINKELNGVNGRKIELEKCVVDGTPAASQSCAQQMVNKKVALVMLGNDSSSGVAYQIYKQAGLFVIGSVPLTSGDLSATNAAFFNSGTAGSGPGTAAYIEKHPLNIKKLAAVLFEVAPAIAAFKLIKKPMEDLGYSVTNATVPVTATDYTAALLSQNPKEVGALNTLLAAQGCIAFGKAYSQQKLTTPVFTVSTCYTPAVLKAIGSAMVGWKLSNLSSDPEGSSADAVLYRKVVKDYLPAGGATGGLSALGFQTIMTTYNSVLKPLAAKGEITSAAIQTYLAGPGKTGKVVLGGDYNCGALKGLPSVCGTDVFFYAIGAGPDYKLVPISEQPDPIDITETVNRSFPKGF
jgi:branched-chain amino acid transport system substrate-binding protein